MYPVLNDRDLRPLIREDNKDRRRRQRRIPAARDTKRGKAWKQQEVRAA